MDYESCIAYVRTYLYVHNKLKKQGGTVELPGADTRLRGSTLSVARTLVLAAAVVSSLFENRTVTTKLHVVCEIRERRVQNE